jgi:hypothetical protein
VEKKNLWELTKKHQPDCVDWYSPETTDRRALDINHIIENSGTYFAVSPCPHFNTKVLKSIKFGNYAKLCSEEYFSG